jgi:hypothetical protein
MQRGQYFSEIDPSFKLTRMLRTLLPQQVRRAELASEKAQNTFGHPPRNYAHLGGVKLAAS